jgi:hypothetical protein
MYRIPCCFRLGILLLFWKPAAAGSGLGPSAPRLRWRIALEDYAAGGLLLFAAILSTRRVRTASLWMLAAWSAVSAMMTLSFLYHLEEILRGEVAEPNNTTVLAVKSLLLATCLTALVLSFRRCHRET